MKIRILTPEGQDYKKLIGNVQKVLLQGRMRMEREKVLTYHKSGQMILNFMQAEKRTPTGGKQFMKHLAADLGMHATVLHRVVRFASMFEKVARGQLLTWSHYRVLIGVTNAKQRSDFEQAALEGRWSAEHLRQKVSASRLKTIQADPHLKEVPRLEPTKGTVGVLRIKEIDSQLFVDLGFEIYRPLAELSPLSWKEGDLVTLREGSLVRANEGTLASDLFTYRAKVLKVVDGDTLRVLIDLGFNMQTRQYLRLRAVNAPEISSEPGRRAKHFVREQLKDSDSLIIRTSKSDKYDRYLSDVFYWKGGRETFLNRQLLTAGLAATI